MTTQRPSAVLRCRLQPQRISTSNLPSRNTGFTPISEGQIVQAKQLSTPTRWSIALDLGNKLTQALENDLDLLLPQHPALDDALTRATLRLVNDWSELFGDDTACDYEEQESAPTDASRLLLLGFGTAAFRAIQTAATAGAMTTSTAQLRFRPKLAAPSASSFKIDNALCLNSAATHIMGMEDKRASLLPWASMQLVRRGISCGVVDVEKEAPKDQPNWWVIANKGALYAAAYDMDWVVFGGMTVYCVGFRTGHHMLWCPVYNRRDEGDEIISQTTQALASIFGDEPPPSDPQTGLPLLVLAVILKGIIDKGGCPWLSQMFANLSGLTFAIPSGEPNLNDHTNFDRDPSGFSDESGSDSGNDGDQSGDFPGGSARRSDNSSRLTRSSAPTTLVSGQHRITGTWHGELAQSAGFSVQIMERLSEGCHGIVYAGALAQNGRVVSAVAIKASDNMRGLLEEFSSYKALNELMGPHIPRCYGLCVTSRTAFLVIARLNDGKPGHNLTKAERGAVYAALKRMHDGGWAHNDVVDPVNNVVHNLLWTDTGRPVLIDLVTVAQHACNGRCAELKVAKRVLGLKAHEIAIWAR